MRRERSRRESCAGLHYLTATATATATATSSSSPSPYPPRHHTTAESSSMLLAADPATKGDEDENGAIIDPSSDQVKNSSMEEGDEDLLIPSPPPLPPTSTESSNKLKRRQRTAMTLRTVRKWLQKIIYAQAVGNIIRALPIFILEKYMLMLLIFFQVYGISCTPEPLIHILSSSYLIVFSCTYEPLYALAIFIYNESYPPLEFVFYTVKHHYKSLLSSFLHILLNKISYIMKCNNYYSLVLLSFISFYLILSYFILFYLILSYFILFYLILFFSILFYSILFYLKLIYFTDDIFSLWTFWNKDATTIFDPTVLAWYSRHHLS